MSPLAFSMRFLERQSDERLLELARGGHSRAFGVLYARHRDPLVAYCQRLVPVTAPDDVVQQAFMQAWQAMHAGVQVRDVKPWLYRIVHNVAISAVRRPAREAAVGVAGGAVRERRASVQAADAEFARQAEARALLESIAALPSRQRDVVVATAMEGRSYAEVAADLGLSSDSVRGLLQRARAALRSAAAALVPVPVLGWLVRRMSGDPGSDAGTGVGVTATGAGAVATGGAALSAAGSAGLAGLLVKGSALLAIVGVLTAAAESRPASHGASRAGTGRPALSASAGQIRGFAPAAGRATGRAGIVPASDPHGASAAAGRPASAIAPGTSTPAGAQSPARSGRTRGDGTPTARGAARAAPANVLAAPGSGGTATGSGGAEPSRAAAPTPPATTTTARGPTHPAGRPPATSGAPAGRAGQMGGRGQAAGGGSSPSGARGGSGNDFGGGARVAPPPSGAGAGGAGSESTGPAHASPGPANSGPASSGAQRSRAHDSAPRSSVRQGKGNGGR